jgi:cytochrome b6-f complex iron-sulfur subunit
VKPPATTGPAAGPRGAARPRSRRLFLITGTAALASAAGAFLIAVARSVVPSVLYEPARRFAAGQPRDYAPDSATLLPEHRVFIVNQPDGFSCLSAVCTHLGCTVASDEKGGYACPCHGSAFDPEGRVLRGPASWPLERYTLSLSRRGELIVDMRKRVDAGFRLRT